MLSAGHAPIMFSTASACDAAAQAARMHTQLAAPSSERYVALGGPYGLA